jgi:hypothetical protein
MMIPKTLFQFCIQVRRDGGETGSPVWSRVGEVSREEVANRGTVRWTLNLGMSHRLHPYIGLRILITLMRNLRIRSRYGFLISL